MEALTNPFMGPQGYGAVTVEDRVRDVAAFNLEQCRAALNVPGLQKAVGQRLRARIRKLEQEG